MRPMLIAFAVVLLAAVVTGAVAWARYSRQFPKPSNEIVQLDSHKREILLRLRREEKFEPDTYYTGVATPEEAIVARSAVNEVLDSILSRGDGPIAGTYVSQQIRRGMKRVGQLETEDRDRTSDYMIEIWYILGFRGATGQFAYGSAFPRPPGYGEPLPRGWKSPTQPRPIGN